ncbi:MAG: VWA domain-containing protein [Deltaproteobacteria bacterium]|nr:VWA domain-containing protein [Deltaproteobacteria bacterium]
MRNLSLIGLAVAALSGCNDYTIVASDRVDIFNQNPAEMVDVLMIVDNSGSMDPYQQKLSQNFDAFIEYFITANVNYHIGVVTTDVEALDAGRIRGQVITPETEDASTVFSSLVRVGTSGSGYEVGLETARMALSEPLVSTANLGFLRNDAALSIIFVSDEEDGSPYAVPSYINAFYNVKGQRARDVFNASALVVTNKNECTQGQADYSSYGTRYVDVAEQTGGVVGNLCSQDFASIITDLSLASSRLRDTFYLSDMPDPASLEVTVNDALLPCEDGAWTYQLVPVEGVDTPAIVFAREQMPPISARITVRYDYGSGDPAGYCSQGV